ncbi:FecR domain-containing protein [Dasania sp. GY-MA-18]|uniref:FecR domain-containing protein n=1 Tax=Dasania phycosphaerae TaxID=2950436 RepID=A0A9J6RHZ6_9GAMM|nr:MULTISPECIES: FecR domain-containing protein [Dasania]MCR8921193.1 FecR domain-containing protein [Dasania sp. GY-MA-18]MCZ0863621.1 FecR domain-containing protein [Dasania phycosphaerae]MCZ0867349.1 FecR domain-containing protein [Dasania phycosphaerae]
MINKLRLALAFICSLLVITSSQAAEWLYTVRPGDNLWNLCKQYTTHPRCWQDLAKTNKVTYPKRLPPGFVISFPVDWLKAIPRPVEVRFVLGEVSIQAPNSDISLAPSIGDKLAIGSKITTQQGHINLRFGDGSLMQLEPHSELLLDSLSNFDGVGIVDSRMRLNQGAVKTRVIKRQPASRFQITTPTAVAAVRGTEYRVSSVIGEQALMRSEVFEGLVDVSAASNSQPVAAGFGIVAKQGQALNPAKPLLPAPKFSINKQAQLLPLQLQWQPVQDAQHYLLSLFEDNDQQELISQWQVAQSQHQLVDLAANCYRLQLRAVDQQQLQGLASQQRLCIAPAISTPILDSSKLKSYNKTATLEWPALANAKRYYYQLALDKNFEQIIDEQWQNHTQLTLSGEQPLYIRIKAQGEQGQTTAYSNALHWQPSANNWPAAIIFVLYALAVL